MADPAVTALYWSIPPNDLQVISNYPVGTTWHFSKDASMTMPRWKQVFLQIALRAMRKVHYEHQALLMGHSTTPEIPDPGVMNWGLGIELAQETHVTTAIVLEFRQSRAAWGWLMDKGKPKNYSIELEPKYSFRKRLAKVDGKDVEAKSRELGDLLVKSVIDSTLENRHLDCFIEAKRFRRWKSDPSGRATRFSPPLEAEIREDIKALQDEYATRCGYGHIMVWGVDSLPKQLKPFIDESENRTAELNNDLKTASNILKATLGKDAEIVKAEMHFDGGNSVEHITSTDTAVEDAATPRKLWILLAEVIKNESATCTPVNTNDTGD